MKRIMIAFVVVLLLLGLTPLFAQDAPKKNLISVNPIGPIFGIISGYYETALSDELSLVVAPTYFNIRLSILGAAFSDINFEWWYLSAASGLNYYLTDETLKGLYAGGRLGVGYMYIGEAGDSATGLFVTPQVTAGYRVIFGNFSLAPQIGVSYPLAFFEYAGITSMQSVSVNQLSYSWGFGLAIAF